MENFEEKDVASLIAAMKEGIQTGTPSKFWRPKEDGVSKIRFLQEVGSFGEKAPFIKYKTHYLGNQTVMCLNQTLKDKDGNIHEAQSCPLCKKASAIYGSSVRGTPDWALATQIRAKERYVSRILVRGNKSPSGEDMEYKPYFFEYGKKIMQMIMSAIETGEYGNPYSFKQGRDFSLVKHGTRLSTSYDGSMFSVNQTPVLGDIEAVKKMKEELQKMDYGTLIEFKTPKELQSILDNFLNQSEEYEEVSASAPISTLQSDQKSFEDAVFGTSSSVEKEEDSSMSKNELEELLNSI